MTCGLTRQSLMNISSSWTNQQATTAKTLKKATSAPTKLNALEINAMTAKCTFCNDTKQEPGIPGPCVWCETADESIKFGTGIMLVGADGAKNVPLVDFLIETKPFRLLPYGTKFRYQSTQDVWVRIGHNLVAKWPCDLFGRDGQPCQSLCSFCHLEGDESGDTLETLVEVVDAEISLIAERDAALGREAALREELRLAKSLQTTTDAIVVMVGGQRDHWIEKCGGLKQRLTVAEQRASDLKKLLCDVINEAPTGFAALKVDLAHRVNAELKQAAEPKHICEGCGSKGWTANCDQCVPH